MNYAVIPTLLVAAVLFAVGDALERKANKLQINLLIVAGALAAIPGVVFAAYYFKIFREPIWLYEFRSRPFTELTASGAGFVAGLLHAKSKRSKQFRRIAGVTFFPGVLLIGLIIPYLKPMVLRPRWDEFQDRWADNICLQTSESSCGPACAATILKLRGKAASEKEIARACFTSRTGTESWYLARALRKLGLDVRFVLQPHLHDAWPFPAIAGVRLPQADNSGHFITILDRRDDKYVVGDPIEGEIALSQSDFQRRYTFTGFFMVVK